MRSLILFIALTFSLSKIYAQDFLCFPNSLSCKYYSCLEEEMQCGEEAYLLSYGKRYCEKFQTDFIQNVALLSPETQLWRLKTSVCLQRTAQLAFKAGDDCELLEEKSFSAHPLCYTNHENSFCTLPAKDITFILAKVLDPKELIMDKKMRKQIYETAKICLSKKKSERSDYDFESLVMSLQSR
jgi:hypothetical protein